MFNKNRCELSEQIKIWKSGSDIQTVNTSADTHAYAKEIKQQYLTVDE